MLGITLVAFVLTELVPSNAAATNLGEQAAADPEAVKAFEEHYGLDKPLPIRYLIYLKHLVHGDLGQSSLTHQAVTHDLGTFIPATAELALYSILFAAIVGVTFGVVAALRRNRPTDHALRVASLAGISMPTFWIALIVLYVGFYRLGWFPGGQRLDPGTSPPPSVTGMYTVDALLDGNLGLFGTAFHHLLLPALVLAAFNVSLLTRFTRSAVLEVIGNDYVRAAPRQGDAGADRRPPLHPPGRAAGGGHRARPRLRERAHRRGARGEDLLLARRRPVRLPGGGQRRRPRDRRRQPLRRGGLRDRELHRRHPLRRSSTRGSGSRDRRRPPRPLADARPPHPPGPAPAARRDRPRDRGRVGRAWRCSRR